MRRSGHLQRLQQSKSWEVRIEVVKPEQLELLSERKNLWKWSNDQWRDKQLRIFWLFSVGSDLICGFKVFKDLGCSSKFDLGTNIGRRTWVQNLGFLDLGLHLGQTVLKYMWSDVIQPYLCVWILTKVVRKSEFNLNFF